MLGWFSATVTYNAQTNTAIRSVRSASSNGCDSSSSSSTPLQLGSSSTNSFQPKLEKEKVKLAVRLEQPAKSEKAADSAVLKQPTETNGDLTMSNERTAPKEYTPTNITRNETRMNDFNGAEQESNNHIQGQLVLPLPDTYLKRHAQTLRSEAEMIRQKEYLHHDTSLPQNNSTGKNKKARIHFVSYGNDKFAAAKERIQADANKTGWFASIHVFGPQDLPQQFQEEFEDILHMERGGGRWRCCGLCHATPVGANLDCCR